MYMLANIVSPPICGSRFAKERRCRGPLVRVEIGVPHLGGHDRQILLFDPDDLVGKDRDVIVVGMPQVRRHPVVVELSETSSEGGELLGRQILSWKTKDDVVE